MPLTFDLTAYPFDAQSVSESQWAAMAGLWRGEGILAHILNEFEVYGDSSGLWGKVRSGRCWIQGQYGESSSEVWLTLAAADVTNPRYDRVVLQWDLANNRIQCKVLTGVASGSPTAPAITRNATIWELSLARITVGAGATVIAAGDVLDERYNPDVCGFSYSASPCLRCKSTLRPSSWPMGGLIYEEDTDLVKINTGTYAAPVWTGAGQLGSTLPQAASITAVADAGNDDEGSRTDHVHAGPGFAAPLSSSPGDVQATGVAATVSRSDHRHAREAFDDTPDIVLGAAAAPGAATTIIRSDATIRAFDATLPVAQLPGLAGDVGAAAFAARRDHAHQDVHLAAYLAVDEGAVVSSTVLVDSAGLQVSLEAGRRYLIEALIIAFNANVAAGFRLALACVSAPTLIDVHTVGRDPAVTSDIATPSTQTNAGALVFGVDPLSARDGIMIRGFVQANAATVLKVQYAQGVSTAALTQIGVGSHLLLHRMN